MNSLPDLAAAQTFVWLNGRLLDRHRYASLFAGGDPDAVVAALRPYQNVDGGFGHAIEPDGRGPSSQPLNVYAALRVLDDVDRCHEPMVTRALDYLAAVTAPDGGVPALLPTARAEPGSPTWRAVSQEAPRGALLPTAGIVGLLHKNRVAHPWLEPATAFCRQAVAAVEETHPYEVEFCLAFLDHDPDRAAAEREARRLGELVRERRLVLLDPDRPEEAPPAPGYAPGEVHTPLNYAPRPTSLARRWFSDEEIARDLDALERGQRDDGGWTINWPEWNPASTCEWRAVVTIEALQTLHAYGRLA